MSEYLVIAGPNGAGKSTLSKTISGYEKSDMPEWANPLITDLRNSFTPDDPGPQLKQGLKR